MDSYELYQSTNALLCKLSWNLTRNGNLNLPLWNCSCEEQSHVRKWASVSHLSRRQEAERKESLWCRSRLWFRVEEKKKVGRRLSAEKGKERKGKRKKEGCVLNSAGRERARVRVAGESEREALC